MTLKLTRMILKVTYMTLKVARITLKVMRPTLNIGDYFKIIYRFCLKPNLSIHCKSHLGTPDSCAVVALFQFVFVYSSGVQNCRTGFCACLNTICFIPFYTHTYCLTTDPFIMCESCNFFQKLCNTNRNECPHLCNLKINLNPNRNE